MPDQNLAEAIYGPAKPDQFDQRLNAVRAAGDVLSTNGKGAPMAVPQTEPGSVLDIIDLADYVVTGRRPGETVEARETTVHGDDFGTVLPPVEIVEGHLDEGAIRTDQIEKTKAWMITLIERYRGARSEVDGVRYEIITDLLSWIGGEDDNG